MYLIYNLILLYGFLAYSGELWINQTGSEFSNTISINARNLEQLNQIIYNKQQQKYLSISCRVQLRKNKIPWTCYEWIHKKTAEKKIKQSLIFYFNEKCQTASTDLNTLKQIHKALQSQHLSLFCRKILQEKKQIIEYQLRDMTPELLFNWYFKKEF